jgi:hypothetical protein
VQKVYARKVQQGIAEIPIRIDFSCHLAKRLHDTFVVTRLHITTAVTLSRDSLNVITPYTWHPKLRNAIFDESAVTFEKETAVVKACYQVYEELHVFCGDCDEVIGILLQNVINSV